MSRARLPLALLPLALTYLAVAMNMTIANVALPTISLDLSASAGQLKWVVNATPVTAGALILFAGALSDRVGHRRMLLTGIVVFILSAAATALVDNVEQLIALRALTGVGSALAMPSALALTFAIASGTAQRTAVGIMGATQAGGAMLGPIVGGAALVAFGWPAAFWSVIPMLAIALAGILWQLPRAVEQPAESDKGNPLDAFGSALAALTLVSLLVAVIAAASESHEDDWQILSGMLVGALAAAGLILWERRTAQPILVGSILRRRTYWVPTLALALVQFTLGGLLFVSTQYLQLVLGYSALGAGLLLVPALLMWTVTSATAGITTKRFGLKLATVVSLLLSATGLLMLSEVDESASMGLLISAMVLTGAMGLTPALMTHTVVSNYPVERRGVGSALNSVVLRFGMAFGVAAYGAVLTTTFMRDLAAAHTTAGGAPAEGTFQSLGAALRAAQEITGPESAALEAAARESFVSGFNLVMLAGAAVLVILALVIWVALPRQLEGSPTAPDETSKDAAGTGTTGSPHHDEGHRS